jgi:hypothetical protein
MPTVATIFGMAIMFFYRDHDPPHFHVRAADFSAKIDLADLSVSEIRGRMTPRDLSRIREWAGRHRTELWQDWALVRAGRQPSAIGD